MDLNRKSSMERFREGMQQALDANGFFGRFDPADDATFNAAVQFLHTPEIQSAGPDPLDGEAADWKSGLTEAGRKVLGFSEDGNNAETPGRPENKTIVDGLIGNADTVSAPPGFEGVGDEQGNRTDMLRRIATGGFIGNEDPELYHALQRLRNSRFMQSPSLPPNYLKTIEDAYARGRIEIRDLPNDTRAEHYPFSYKINISRRTPVEYLPGRLAHEGYHRYMRRQGLENNLNEEEMAHILADIIDLEMNPGIKNLHPLTEEELIRIKKDYRADNNNLKDIGDAFDPFPR